MGLRGPAPKPTRLKVLQGNPGHRPLPKNEPKPPPIAPDMPAWLNRVAKAEWRRMGPGLERLGMLTGHDQAAFASYCVAYSDLVAARDDIDRNGLTMTIVTANGGSYTQPRPSVAIANNAMKLIRAFCQEFGMTPSARGRMSMPELPAPKDDLLD